ncbi:hypothetical protein MMC13_003526 [Lambiella insularis]|nr:hypothetical protein [Lambiella insularis]
MTAYEKWELCAPDIKSVILLGLTSTYFWNTCRRHVWSYQRLYHGQWSGEKIICVGEHIKPFDHPPGLFSEHEARHLFSNEFYRARLGLEKGQNADLHSFASTFDEEPKDWRLTYMLDLSEVYGMDWYDLVYSVLGNNHRPSDFADMCKPRLSDFYPENQSWILRNLTTLEYIRSEAIALKPEYIRGPFIDYLGFGHVVLSRICWSSNSLSSVEDDVSTMRGIWAGHRFDITTVEKHKQSIRNYEEWEDISEEIAQEVARIWESVFGEHWREKLDFDGVF